MYSLGQRLFTRRRLALGASLASPIGIDLSEISTTPKAKMIEDAEKLPKISV